MSEYNTEQKKALLEFLKRNSDSAYTVEELIERLRAEHGSAAPGSSTVYRLVTRLVKEGTVKRFVKGSSRTFVYQIITSEGCHHHLHLRCTACGKLLHLDGETSEALLLRVAAAKNFTVSQEDTVLLGKCARCGGKN